MNKFLPYRLIVAICFLWFCSQASSHAQWTSVDIGTPSISGTASISGTIYSVSGCGNFWGSSDTGHYLYQSLSGTGSIVAQVLAVSGTIGQASAGVMIRGSTDPHSQVACTEATQLNDKYFILRSATGASMTDTATTPTTIPYWIKVVRTGTNNFSSYISASGTSWTLVATGTTGNLPNTVDIGLCACSSGLGQLVTGTFTNVTITGAPGLGPNILPNSSFEGGAALWNVKAPFSVINSASNAHTGTYALQAVLSSTLSNSLICQLATVWPNTNYVTSVWAKGAGKLTFGVRNNVGYANIASTTVTGSSTWQQINVPWNSGTACTTAQIYFADWVSGNTGTTLYLDDCTTCLVNGDDIQFNPANPGASGYSLYFDEEFNNESMIDVNHTGANGYNWYVGQFFGSPTTSSTMYSVSGTGTLTISGCPVTWGSTIHTTEPDANNGQGFHGTVFTAGGGVYFEARIAMMNTSSIGSNAWPCFWSTDMKRDTGLNEQMPGNPLDYEEIEDDFMEYNPTWGDGCGYLSTMHDWCGTIATGTSYNINNDNNLLPLTLSTDFTQWHTYGSLWVPGTADNGWMGYRQEFFDGVPQAAVCWQGNQVGTFPPIGSYLFSLKDQDQFEVILGASQGGTPTMQVDYVHVYAVSPSSVTFVPNGLTPVVSSTLTATGTVGSLFNYNITATHSPTSYGASGLPSPLSVNTGTGLISGTPSATGTSSVVISGSNAVGAGAATLKLTIVP